MPIHNDYHLRIEPRRSPREDLQRGFAAEVADPVWFVGRQWQMGEHQGENAASPVRVSIDYSRAPLEESPDRPGEFPGKVDGQPITPAEAIVEGEHDDWWTLGRRVRLGLRAAPLVDGAALAVDQSTALRLVDLPPPYEIFSGGYDGRALFEALESGALPEGLRDALVNEGVFAEVPTTLRGDHWDPKELVYTAELSGGGATLAVDRHDGDDVDWWSLEAQGPLDVAPATEPLAARPSRFRYPGAPHPRWWQIEDATVDIGGFPPDRSHFPTMLLLDLILAHSDDWFTVPVRPPDGHIGDVLALHSVVVTDIFGDDFEIEPPQGWSLFKVRGLESTTLALVPTVATPLVGEAIEQVSLGTDEDANLLFAVEERSDGRHLASATAEPASTAADQPDFGGRIGYLYRPSTAVPHHWHPYVIDEVPHTERRFVQARLADYTKLQTGGVPPTRDEDWLAPEPRARLLRDDHANPPDEPTHQIAPPTVPVQGLRLDRRYVLGRRSDATPVLWVQRRRMPLLSPPTSGLRFDVVEKNPHDGP
jgi:hypothetical protein